MRNFLRVIFGLNVIFLAMLALAYPGIEPGSGAAVVAMLSLVVIAVTMLASGALIYVGWDPVEGDHWREYIEEENGNQ